MRCWPGRRGLRVLIAPLLPAAGLSALVPAVASAAPAIEEDGGGHHGEIGVDDRGGIDPGGARDRSTRASGSGWGSSCSA
jgi:hypothetical protein